MQIMLPVQRCASSDSANWRGGAPNRKVEGRAFASQASALYARVSASGHVDRCCGYTLQCSTTCRQRDTMLKRMHALTLPFATTRERISGAWLKGALIAGAGRVLSRREELNRINVFPVPDGDTGTNMAFTMLAVMRTARRLPGANLGAVLRSVAREAIDGSRGNSGAILAQFFQGLAQALGSCAHADADELASATSSAAQSARACLADPREGTMLSVIHDFAGELRRQADAGATDLSLLFRRALERARQSLANTPNLLPVLRAAGVVDAGAAGFVDFLEGVQDFIVRGRGALRMAPDSGDGRNQPIHLDQVHLEAVEADSRYRYCTECVLTGENLDLARVRDLLGTLELDSLVVAGGTSRVRVHTHIDRPNQLFEALTALGSVTLRKADDMQAQSRLRAAAFQRVRVVTDSAGDLPASEIERLGIIVVPIRILFGEDDYLDRITLSPRELYQRLRREPAPPRTSQPPPGDFRRAFDLVLAHCESLVSIELSSRLSGTFQAAEIAGREAGAKRIQVIDTLNVAGGQGLITLAAAECALAGGDAVAVAAAARTAMGRIRTFALIRDLRYGVRGGRIPKVAKHLADLLGLTVLIANKNGLVRPFSALMGSARLVERFAAVVARRAVAGCRYRAIVGHCDARDDAASLAGALRERLPGLDRIWVVETGPAVGVHAGPGSLVVGLESVPQ